MQLDKALLCLDCREISESTINCPRCTSSALVGLWRFLPNVTSTATIMETHFDTRMDLLAALLLAKMGIILEC